MKNQFLKTTILFLTIFTLLSCSKDDDDVVMTPPTFVEENFLFNFLTSTGFIEKVEAYVNNPNYEYGTEFTPIVNGKITKIYISLPDANPQLRISIWDKATTTVIRTETVNYNAQGFLMPFDITDLDLEKNKQYCITINSNDFYQRKRTDNSAISYPITVNNIKIDGYRYGGGSNSPAIYPQNFVNNYMIGDISFDFIQTN